MNTETGSEPGSLNALNRKYQTPKICHNFGLQYVNELFFQFLGLKFLVYGG